MQATNAVSRILSEGERGRVGQDVGEVDIYPQCTKGERGILNIRDSMRVLYAKPHECGGGRHQRHYTSS